MNRTTKKTIAKQTADFLILMATLASCGEEQMHYSVSTDTPIVESYIQAGSTDLTVEVYSMEIYLKDSYELSWPIEGLLPEINGRPLTETAAGTYTLNLGTDIVSARQAYSLTFDHKGKTITATTTVPEPVTGLTIAPQEIERTTTSYFWGDTDTTEITLTWDDPDNSYYQLYIESPAATDGLPMGGGTEFRRRVMQPFRGGSYTTTSREFMTTGDYWIFVYRVNRDYVDLYERASSTDLANPSTAITNAFGIFTAMSVAKIRFRVIETAE
jgi:hypothetical protein